uniref:Retrotransposon gag domain-containing protein n=1 Tax=Cannabis sativa TaxID=3483 RepID=A0A803P3L6_CANSA
MMFPVRSSSAPAIILASSWCPPSSMTRCNNMVMSWLVNFVSAEIAQSIMHFDLATGMWQDLGERFNEANGPRIFQLRTQLTRLYQGDQSVTSYFTKLKSLCDELKEFQPITTCICGAMKAFLDYYSQNQVLQFLTGLNESYALHASRTDPTVPATASNMAVIPSLYNIQPTVNIPSAPIEHIRKTIPPVNKTLSPTENMQQTESTVNTTPATTEPTQHTKAPMTIPPAPTDPTHQTKHGQLIKKPSHLDGYVCHKASTVHPIEPFLFYIKLHLGFRVAVLAAYSEIKPQS